ncbi:Heat shock protein F84.1 [Chromobacterium violaceum]|uniref:Heat shock protein F84.1 n=1 Tax=Chromobacterium violaceum TaxID=536 RepID=A0A447TBS8_CHRVL|nr:Heat shock protein F84.1 [Chromobacterium violaceum]
MGAGKADGAMDAGNMLKPALARGELHCIGATTLDEYRKYIEKDAALERRFQKVLVGEPSVEDTIAILRGLQEKYEIHHGVDITDPAIVAAAELSQRYITDRFLPDKAIDLIDEAASRIKMELDSKPEAMDKLDRRLIQLKIEREAVNKESDEASQKRLKLIEDEIAELSREYADLEEIWKAEKAAQQGSQSIKEEIDRLKVDMEELKRKGDWQKLAELQYGKLPQLEARLKEAESAGDKARPSPTACCAPRWRRGDRRGGQPGHRHPGVQDVDRRAREAAENGGCAAPARGRAGRGGQRGGRRHPPFALRPGRSQQAVRLLPVPGTDRRRQDRAVQDAGQLPVRQRRPPDPHRHVRVHGEAFGGAADRRAAGYVGYEEGGYLTEQVRRKPYSVILLDEVEKAHPDVFNVLLQVLDDGRLTDGQGRTVDFKNTVIVMTSNIGSQQIQAMATDDYQVIKLAVMAEVKTQFRPEFINRIDEVVVFHGLDEKHIQSIAASS